MDNFTVPEFDERSRSLRDSYARMHGRASTTDSPINRSKSLGSYSLDEYVEERAKQLDENIKELEEVQKLLDAMKAEREKITQYLATKKADAT